MKRITITQAGIPAVITWDNGTLGGDAAAVAQLRALAQRCEGQPIGMPDLPKTRTNHLQSNDSTIMLCAQLSDRWPTIETVDAPAARRL